MLKVKLVTSLAKMFVLHLLKPVRCVCCMCVGFEVEHLRNEVCYISETCEQHGNELKLVRLAFNFHFMS